MSIPQTSDSMGNVLRLQGLKNVSGRKKVLPGAQFLHQMDLVDPDVSGASSDAQQTSQNLPQLDMVSDLSPQSYDVRANEVISTEQPSQPMDSTHEEPENLWRRFGRALAAQSGHYSPKMDKSPPPIATQQVDESEGIPPVNPEMQGQEPPESANTSMWNSVGNALKDYIKPFTSSESREKIDDQNAALLRDAQMRTQGLNPEEELAKQAKLEADKQASLHDDLDRAQQNPLEVAVYGATDSIAKSPELQKEFHEITGVDFTPEIEEMTKKYEQVMSDMDKGLNQEGMGYDEQAKRIKERIDSNSATDMDKYYIGMALLMPLLIGGIFGKEAGLGALGGGAKGIADVLGRRVDQTRKDEELLAEVNKNKGTLGLKRSELELEKLKIPQQIKKNLPADERAFLKGKKEFTWKDPETGETKAGVEIKPGLVALPQFLTSPEDLKEMTKAANELKAIKGYTEELNDLTEDIIQISSQLKDKEFFKKAAIAAFSGKLPAGSLSKLTEDVMLDGRKVNAGIALENKIGLLSNAYAQAKQLGQLDKAAQDHISKLISNPSKSLATSQDAINQILEIRKLAQNGLVRDVANAGFAPEFIIDELGKKNRKMYGGLNKKEEEKMSSALLRE